MVQVRLKDCTADRDQLISAKYLKYLPEHNFVWVKYRLSDLCFLALSREELQYAKDNLYMDQRAARIRDALVRIHDEDDFGSYKLFKMTLHFQTNHYETRVGVGDSLQAAYDCLRKKLAIFSRYSKYDIYSGTVMWLETSARSTSAHLKEFHPKFEGIAFALETPLVRVESELDMTFVPDKLRAHILFGLERYHFYFVYVMLNKLFLQISCCGVDDDKVFSAKWVIKTSQNYITTTVYNPYFTRVNVGVGWAKGR
jgi:hypothetical protein